MGATVGTPPVLLKCQSDQRPRPTRNQIKRDRRPDRILTSFILPRRRPGPTDAALAQSPLHRIEMAVADVFQQFLTHHVPIVSTPALPERETVNCPNPI